LTAELWFLALLRSFGVGFHSFPFFIFQSLVDLDGDNLGQSSINLAFTISGQSTVGVGDIMPQEEEVQDHCDNQR
jgi:hypothetical protein